MNQFSRGLAVVVVSILFDACLACAQAPVVSRPELDERSVLLEWSAEEEAKMKQEREPGAKLPDAQQQELDERVEEGLAHLGRGTSEEALVIFNQVLRVDPKNKRARFGLGTAYIQMERYGDALKVLEPMSEDYPDDFMIKNNIAWLYATARDASLRNGSKAIRFAQEALLLQPGSYQVWNTLSESYFISGEYEKAQRAAMEALKLSQQANAPQSSVTEYRHQAEKSRRAAQAMSLLD